MNNTAKTYKVIYKDYANRNVMNTDIEHMLEKFISYLKGKDILDIRCAQGRESKYLSEKGFEVTGIDITEEFLELARHNCPSCQFINMDMTDLQFQAESFDGIWACASFLHIPKDIAVSTLLGFKKVLKTNGLLYLSVMEGEYDNERRNEDMDWDLRHFSDYQEQELKNLLLQCGYIFVELVKRKTPSGRTFMHIFATKPE